MEASERLTKYYSHQQPNWGMILTNIFPFVRDVMKMIFEHRKSNGKIKLIELVMDVHGDEECSLLKERINKILKQ